MADVIVDGKTVSQNIINKEKYIIENIIDLELYQDHLLQLKRYNKSDDQCIVIGDEKKDQYIILDQVCIDGIDVQNLIWNRSWYEPEYPKLWKSQQEAQRTLLEEKVIGETWLSHNGIWNFKFFSPFYKFVIAQFR